MEKQPFENKRTYTFRFADEKEQIVDGDSIQSNNGFLLVVAYRKISMLSETKEIVPVLGVSLTSLKWWTDVEKPEFPMPDREQK